MSGFLCLEFPGGNALADQGALQSGLGQLDLGIGGILLAQDTLGPLLGLLGAVRVDLVGPLKGGGDQGHGTVHDTQQTADAGCGAPLAISLHDCLTHAQGEHGIDMPGQDGGVAGGGADDELVGLTVKNQTVGVTILRGKVMLTSPDLSGMLRPQHQCCP